MVALLIDFREAIPVDEFLYNVVSLSYVGDVRFALGAEKQTKVVNILEGNYERIRQLYVEQLGHFREFLTLDGRVLRLENSDRTLY